MFFIHLAHTQTYVRLHVHDSNENKVSVVVLDALREVHVRALVVSFRIAQLRPQNRDSPAALDAEADVLGRAGEVVAVPLEVAYLRASTHTHARSLTHGALGLRNTDRCCCRGSRRDTVSRRCASRLRGWPGPRGTTSRRGTRRAGCWRIDGRTWWLYCGVVWEESAL